MYCPRLDHFVRFNPDGTVSRCGHMVAAPTFKNLQHLESSQWLKNLKKDFDSEIWPDECVRCKDMENIGQLSIRNHSVNRHDTETTTDYLQVGGVLDNVCNSACQFCSELLSTKIGSLSGSKTYPIVNNSQAFFDLPQDRITMLDINGGEPGASKNYRRLLRNLPPNLKKIRINTNGSLVISELEKIADAGIEVIVTMSFDGMGLVHDYIRWPIKWTTFEKTLEVYRNNPNIKLDLWTTVNVFNINTLDQIVEYAKAKSIDHSYALLTYPVPLNVKYKNSFTEAAKIKYSTCDTDSLISMAELLATYPDNSDDLQKFIKYNDQLRGIKIQDYLGKVF